MVRTYVRKRTYKTLERVLVHLSTDALRPKEQTQDGIAAATRSGRSTLTKWLDRMGRRGLVSRERIRLPGEPLPRYGYRLTDAGWRMATDLRQRLVSQVVTVRATNVEALSVRMSEVPSLAQSRLDLAGAVASVRKGRLDLGPALSDATTRGPLVWDRGLHRVDRFFGREGEFADFDAWWASDSRILLVTGLAGIGKSALIAAWVKARQFGVPVYAFDAHGATATAAFVNDLGGFLSAVGLPALATRLAEGLLPESPAVLQILRRDFRDRRMLMILDNADQVDRDAGRLLKNLFGEDPGRLRAKLVLLGRRAPCWIPTAARTRAVARMGPLRGLDVGASKALLRSHGIPSDSDSAAAIVRETRGHPLLLHLAASAGKRHGPVVQQYLRDELWGSLSKKDQTILEAASVFRTPVSERVLETVARTDHRSLERLAERNLLERTIAGGYLMHDLLRETVAGRASRARRRVFHLRAAELLAQSADSRQRWEGVHHLFQAGEAAEAARRLDSEGALLLDSVAAEEITAVAHDLTLDETDPLTYCVFAEVLADSLRIRGHVPQAQFQYRHAQRFAETSGHPERIPRLLRKMAYLERCRNRYEKALGYLVEARARLSEQRNPAEMVEVLREMALSEQAVGDLEHAGQHLSEAIDLATDLSDLPALSRAFLAFGSLEVQRGRGDQGLALDLEGLRIAERSGDATEVAHAHLVVGAALIGTGRAEESLKHLTEGLETARLLGNLRLMAYAAMNQTSALLHLNRYKEAGSQLQDATGHFEILGEKDALGLLKTYEGEVEMGLGHWSRATRAWKEGINELKSRGSPAELALVLRDVAGFYAKQGHGEEGRAFLLEARGIARKVGNLDLLSRIDSELAVPRTPAA